ncbi:MAG: Wzz/FepE/Etk N-terminal domain-containing protein, partial [Acidobacteriaceae bacterium]
MPELSQLVTEESEVTGISPAQKSRLFLSMLQNRRLFLKCAFVGAMVGGILSFLIHSRYDSQAQLMPPDQNNSGMLVGLAMDRMQSMGIPPDLLGAKTSGALFV